MATSFVLVNANVSTPPVSPVGLEYTGHALEHFGIGVDVIDLAMSDDWRDAVRAGLNNRLPLLVGISVRNTDDVCLATGRSFLPWIREVIQEVRKWTSSPIVLGGVGYSVMPVEVLRQTGAEFGIDGDGELASVALSRALIAKSDLSNLPNLVYWHKGNVVRNRRAYFGLENLPLPRRRLFRNSVYEKTGGMVGIETKRGCHQHCIYCADPVSKGSEVRVRPPNTVVAEIRELLNDGVSWFHFCDSEFNQPLRHARDVCRAIIDAGLGDRIRWYCYCSPIPFDAELADVMLRAGCAGINFGVDSLVDEQLARLGRQHNLGHVRALVGVLKRSGLNFIFDLIIGGPGETPDSVRTTISRVKEMAVPIVGISVGVRVYPGTPLGNAVSKGLFSSGVKLRDIGIGFEPLVFYCSPALGDDPLSLVRSAVGNDPRFLLLSGPSDADSYNYADDQILSRAILDGARGAYWDIIARRRGQSNPQSRY